MLAHPLKGKKIIQNDLPTVNKEHKCSQLQVSEYHAIFQFYFYTAERCIASFQGFLSHSIKTLDD